MTSAVTPPLPASEPAGLSAMPDFVRLWVANLLCDVGAQFAALALSVTAVVVLRASALEVAVIAALANGAYLVLGMPIGVLADRIPSKRMLVAADLARFAAVATVPIAAFGGVLTVWQPMAVAAISSAANVVFDIAHSTVLPVLVGKDRVSQAAARLQTVDSSVSVVGPALAGQLIAWTSGPVAYLVTAAAHLGSSISAAAIRGGSRPDAASRVRFGPALREGLAYVLHAPVQRSFMIAAATINFGAGFTAAIWPLFALRTLGFTPAEYGFVLAFGGVGGIVASLLGLRIRRLVGEIRTPIICYSALPFVFALTPLAPVLPWSPLVSLAVSEFLISFVILVSTISSTGVQVRSTPARIFGRATAARRTVTMGVLPLGSLVAGALAHPLGDDGTLWVGAAIMPIAFLAFAMSPLFRHRDLPPEWDVREE